MNTLQMIFRSALIRLKAKKYSEHTKCDSDINSRNFEFGHTLCMSSGRFQRYKVLSIRYNKRDIRRKWLRNDKHEKWSAMRTHSFQNIVNVICLLCFTRTVIELNYFYAYWINNNNETLYIYSTPKAFTLLSTLVRWIKSEIFNLLIKWNEQKKWKGKSMFELL